eukprot:775802_1
MKKAFKARSQKAKSFHEVRIFRSRKTFSGSGPKVSYSGPAALLNRPSRQMHPKWRKVRRYVFLFIMLRRVRNDGTLYGLTITPEQFALQDQRMDFQKDMRRKTLLSLGRMKVVTPLRSQLSSSRLAEPDRHAFVHVGGHLRKTWEHLVLAMIAYCLCILPFRIGLTETVLWNGWDLALDAFFVFDIFINYFTVQDEFPTLSESSASRRRYLHSSGFIFDVSQSLPLYLFHLAGGSVYFRDCLRLLRWIKVFRLNRLNRVQATLKDSVLIRSRQNFKDKYPVAHRALSILVFILLLLHSFGCLWYFVSTIFRGHGSGALFEKTWTERLQIEGEATGIWTKYVLSVYWMVTTFTTVGYADAFPNTPIERIFSAIVGVAGLACLAYVTANFTSVVTQHDSARTELEIRMAGILKFCSHHKLPQP